MNFPAPSKAEVESVLTKRSGAGAKHASDKPTVLVATADPEIRTGLGDLFQGLSFNTAWSKGVQAAKNMLAKERIAACLCGFWLQDGTYRELVRHIRRARIDIPVIIVCAPACPDEYRDYLAAMNIGALDFLCYPYQKIDLERMLLLATEPYMPSMSQRSMIGSGEFA